MKIPKKLTIGESCYNIKQVRRIDWSSTVVGQINYHTKKIKIRMNKKDDKLNEETFFHEIAHGILKELEFNTPKITRFRQDESFIHEMGLMLRNTFLELLDKQEKEKNNE